ncbi:gamma-glutamyltransferase family protein [Marinomonas dokdonensis]|uniref:gamma-glutamyltransferase family protein n=1 Tax=Marinomonas dokdonensis TaxID=328224 RepID=UPI0040557370
MNIHSTSYPFTSQRNAVYSTNGMVATSQPLAAQAGLNILQKGGNAIDAAIAVAAALTVVEPTSNGIGGDAFALVWMKDKLHGLNANGMSPASISIDALKAQGLSEMPTYGWTPVTVPGVPSAWSALNKRWGNLSLLECLTPAINYATEGFPISPTLAKFWKVAFDKFSALRKKDNGEIYQEWLDVFAPNGKSPTLGDIWKSPAHAKTLRLIGETNGDAFYKGELANKIYEAAKDNNAFLSITDLIEHEVEWVDPISVNYNGYDIWEMPPSGQGTVALMALNIMKQFNYKKVNDAENIHKQIEAMKLAFADGLHNITDINEMTVSVDELLDEGYAKKRAQCITEEAQEHCPGDPKSSGTVYLATADNDGNMVSFIQSNYMGFGSGVVVPGTGIALQNRGQTFSLNPKDINCLKGKKKTYHTIIPGFITKNNQAIGPFGVMGGFMQPQGHMQVIMSLIDFGLNPQSALDAPRWQWVKGNDISVEQSMPSHIIQSLIERGHNISIARDGGTFGRGQIIIKDTIEKQNLFVGGTEHRTDGAVVGY